VTAFNLFVGARAAYLLSDSGVFDDNGAVVGFLSKVVMSPRLRAATVSAGHNCCFGDSDRHELPLHRHLRGLIMRSNGQADFLGGLPQTLREAVAEAAVIAKANDGGETQIKLGIALWDEEEDEPAGYVVASPGHGIPWLADYHVVDVTGMASPPVDRRFWPEERAELTPRIALALIEEQRRTPDERGVHSVAGAVEMVTVDRAGVHVSVIKRWPDKLWRRVDPHRRRWWPVRS